jgi:hypothetical protein
MSGNLHEEPITADLESGHHAQRSSADGVAPIDADRLDPAAGERVHLKCSL